MNTFGKILLALCSLGPFFLTSSINAWHRSEVGTTGFYTSIGLFVVFLGTCVISWALPKLVRKTGERIPLTTKKVKPADKEMVAFLLLYMLPLLTKENSISFAGDWLTGIVVLVVIIFAVTHSNAFTFNPLLALISKYHFYEVEDDKGLLLLLLTKKRIKRPDATFQVTHLVDYVYIDME